MFPSADGPVPGPRTSASWRLASTTLLASASLLVVAPVAMALPPSSTAPVVDIAGPVLAVYAGTAEIDGSTTIEPTRTGSKSRLDCTVLFGKDSDVLLPGAKERLHRLAVQLRAQGAGRVAITGYTDDLGSAAHGLDLSERRARRVAHELGRTLPERQFPMTVRGLGEAHPAVPNTSEANRRQNRRVVVTLTRTKVATPPTAPTPTPTPTPTPGLTQSLEATPGAPSTPSPTTALMTATRAAGPPPPPSDPDRAARQTDELPWPWIGGIGAALVIVGGFTDRLRRRQVVRRSAAEEDLATPSSARERLTTLDVPAPPARRRGGPSNPALLDGAEGDAPVTAAATEPGSRQEDDQPTPGAGRSRPSSLTTVPLSGAQPALTAGPAASLADDLAAWRSPDTHRPRLSVLGPVHARTRGKALARRRPYYTELFAYLALRPSGATVDEIADAFTITPARVRTDMKILRDWLGADPNTGKAYLPDARTTAAALRRGTAVYQLEGTLCDWHLFTRLQAAAARADDAERAGQLQAALDLVTGPAFDHLRPAGWNWLLEGHRVDLHAAKAASDVAVELLAYHQAQQNDTAARTVMEVLGWIDPERAQELSKARSS